MLDCRRPVQYGHKIHPSCGEELVNVQTLAYPPIIPIPELAEWGRTLHQIAAEPLEFCEDFPLVARRYEAWWAQEVIDRPIFMASANRRPDRPITRRLDLLDQPDLWLETKLEDLRQTHHVGDALPWVRADFGAVLLAGMYGGVREHQSDTAWTHRFLDDEWSNAPDWSNIDGDNEWWRRFRTALLTAASEAPGRYLVCPPDLGGSGDVLLLLRGSANLAMDTLDQPERIRAAVEAIYPGWRRALIEMFRCTVERKAGLAWVFGPWSSRPYTMLACDFNALIGPKQFESLFLPDIARQAATVDRSIFHLDGPAAARHIDALLAVPEIDVVQFTPGAGAPSALAWVDMFRKIQDHGKSVLVICPPEEVIEVCQALRPEGLALLLESSLTPAELDDLYAEFCRFYG